MSLHRDLAKIRCNYFPVFGAGIGSLYLPRIKVTLKQIYGANPCGDCLRSFLIVDQEVIIFGGGTGGSPERETSRSGCMKVN